MSTGRYAGRVEFSKAVHKGGDKAQYESIENYSVMIVNDSEVRIDVAEGYVLEPIARSGSIGNVNGPVPAMTFRFRKI